MHRISIVVLSAMLVLSQALVFAQGTTSNNSTANSPAGSSASSTNNSAQLQQMMKARYGATGGSPMGMYPNFSKEKIQKFVQALLEMGLLYKMLEQPTIVSSDNGVIVAYGNTLKKYDKDLNVVKEVDLDVDLDGMQGLASKFAQKYSDSFMDLMGMKGSSSNSIGATASAMPSSASSSNPAYDEKKEEQIKKEIDQIK